MTIYYNPKSPIISCLTDFKRWKFTCMYTVMVQRWEFWFFVLFHAALAVATSTKGLDTSNVGEPPASAAALVQFFMTFFITFYNKHCFARYNKLYVECMNVLDGAIFFVYEMTVSLGHTQLESHRVQATKYILAVVYTFFMGITGGELTPKEWHECERKGLLTKAETEALAEYPGHSYTLVLSTWAMQVIDDALENDCVWTKRSQRIAHLHNRLNNNIIGMLSACHTVGHIIACPIPFPYYHLMNLVLVLNFILVACVLALLQSLFTIVPYMVVVLIFLGLREVATQLADPFGDDAVDFPVAEFLNYVTDQIVCLLETFNRMDISMLREAVAKERGFTSAQLLRQVDKQQLYKASGINFLDSSFNWHRAKALNKFDEDENPVTRLREMFKNPPVVSAADYLNHAQDIGLTEEDVALQLQQLHTKIQSGEEELKDLQKMISELEAAQQVPAGQAAQASMQARPAVNGASAAQANGQEDRRAPPPHHHHHHHHHDDSDYEDDHHDDVSEGSVRYRGGHHRRDPSPQRSDSKSRSQPQPQPEPQQATSTALVPVQQEPADFTSMAHQIRNIKAAARGSPRDGSGTAARAKSSGEIIKENGRRPSTEKATAPGFGSFAEARAQLQRFGHGAPPEEAVDDNRQQLALPAAAAAPSQAPDAVMLGRPAVPMSNGAAYATPRGGKTASRSASREMPAPRSSSREAPSAGSGSGSEAFADARAAIRSALEATKTDVAEKSSSRERRGSRRSSPAGSDTSSARRRRSRS